jgi:hypothetical protein
VVIPLVRICAGGAQQWASLLRTFGLSLNGSSLTSALEKKADIQSPSATLNLDRFHLNLGHLRA